MKLYPLSFSRLKNIAKSDAAFIAACVMPKEKETAAMMQGRVIHRALLFNDYRVACKTVFNDSNYPSTIADMKALIGNIPNGRLADYEAECAEKGILTASAAKLVWQLDQRDWYDPNDVEMIDALVEAAGDRFKDGMKEYHFEAEYQGVPVHGYIDHYNGALCDIKTYAETGRSFYQVAANMMYPEQLAFYELCGLDIFYFSIYGIELSPDGYATSREFIFDKDMEVMNQARKRVHGWIERAKLLEPMILQAKEATYVSMIGPTVRVKDSDMPMYYYD